MIKEMVNKMKRHKCQNRFLWCTIVLGAFFFTFSSAAQATRQRETLADPHPSATLSGIIIATPLFEQNANKAWDSYKRPFQSPIVKLFGKDKDLLLYSRTGFADGAVSAELAALKNKAGKYVTANLVLKEALQARQKARWIIHREITGGKAKRREAAGAEANKELRLWIDEPLILLARTPIIGYEDIGPHAAPQPVAVYDSSNTCIACDSFYVVLTDAKKNPSRKVSFDIEKAVENNTLDLVICHEMAHGIMFDAFGRPDNTNIGRGPSINGHSPEYITDRVTSFSEGWAEAFEAFFGRNKKNVSALGESKYGIASFLIGRQDQVRRDRWLWLEGKANRDASMKNAAQMMACEGVIAGLFFDILSNRALVSPFEKSIEIMVCRKPLDFPAFLNAWLELFPGDRRVILRIFLEHTRYATLDPEIAELYRASYLARRRLGERKGNDETLMAAEKAYVTAKEEAFAKILVAGDPFAGMPAQMWFGLELVRRSDNKVTRFIRINLDLNTADEFLLNYSELFTGKDLDAFLELRAQKRGFKGKPLTVLQKIMGAERWKKLSEEGFQFYEHPLSR